MVGPLEFVGPKLEIGSVLLPSGELVGSLIELAGPVDCEWLKAGLVGGRLDASRDCREHRLDD